MRTRRKEISQIRAGDTGECRFLFLYKMKSVCVVYSFFVLYCIFCLLTRGDCTGREFGLCPWEVVIQMDGGRRPEEKERISMRKSCDCVHASVWTGASPSVLLLRGYKPMLLKNELSWGKMHWSIELSLNHIMFFSSAWLVHRLYLWASAVVK